MSLLNLDLIRDTHISKIAAVQGHGLHRGTEFRDRAHWASRASQVQTWCKSDRSELLFIQGKESSESTSPLSYLVSQIHEDLQDQKDTLVLSFFCGRDTISQTNPDTTGPMDLVRAMLAQILALRKTADIIDGKGRSPSSLLLNDQIMGMKDGNLSAYMAVISALVLELQVHLKAIFILVDGIDFFHSDWEDEVQEVIQGLSRVAFQRRGLIGGPLKVLFTASTPSHCFEPSTRIPVVLEMPKDIKAHADFAKFGRFS